MLSWLVRCKDKIKALVAAIYQRRDPQDHLLVLFFCTMLSYTLFYRFLVYTRLYSEGQNLFSFSPKSHSMWFMMKFLWNELVFVAALCAILLLCLRGLRRLWRQAKNKFTFFLGLGVLHVILVLVAMTYDAHYQLMFTMRTGLQYDVIVETMGAEGSSYIASLLKPIDIVMFVMPFLLLWGFLLLPARFTAWRNRVLGTITALLLLFHMGQLNARTPLGSALRESPVLFVLNDFLQHYVNSSRPVLPPELAPSPTTPPSHTPTKPRLGLTSDTKQPQPPTLQVRLPFRLSKAQMRSLQWIDPHFVHTTIKTQKTLPPKTDKRWNIIYISMESTGFRYIFNTPEGQPDAMPFLRKLATKSWLFTKHFSPSNSSPRSYFSMFSGLNPLPRLSMYSMRKDLSIPSAFSFLDKHYKRRFLYSPASTRWYFPKWLLLNSGLKEIYDISSPAVRHLPYAPRRAPARHEAKMIEAFGEQIVQSPKPFAAYYTTFIPHWPYTDYGPKYHLHKSKRSIHRYYNNLYLLDRSFKKLFEMLEKKGLLDHTIVVFTGDHGEAFGQHKDNYTHSRRSFNENFHTPLMFYQPKLFKARKIKQYTSHADILPTLLDALRIPYNPKLLQGESLFQRQLRRKYIFLFGNENTLSSISQQGIKMQFSFKNRSCWVFDLQNDPDERRYLSCRGHTLQFQSLLLYHKYQQHILFRYNRAMQDGEKFHGEKHPGLD